MAKKPDFDFYPYLVENAEELRKFSRDVNILSASALTQLQRLPVTLRRRAASHNVKRLPFRFRKLATVSAAKKVVRKCRKYRRRHMDVREIFASRQSKNKWLCTHIWHAKRFRMENKWGWRLPMLPNLKTFRPCTKAMSQGCGIIDISYFESFELRGSYSPVLLATMRSLLDRNEADNILDSLTNGFEVSCVLYEASQSPYGAICPIKILRISENSILLNWHPAANTQVLSALTTSLGITEHNNSGCWTNGDNTIVLVNRGGDLCRYRLLGHGGYNVLTTILGDGSEMVGLRSRRMTDIAAGYSVEMMAEDPSRSKPKLRETDIVMVPRPAISRIPLEVAITAKSLLETDEGVLIDRMQGSIAIDRFKHLKPIEQGEKCPIRLIRHRHGGMTSGGWDVIVPCKWGMRLWTTLIMKGCRPTGLRHWSRFCAVEASSLAAKSECFPGLLWPDTMQGALEADQSATRLEGAWKRRPPAKRVNYTLQACQHPFRCPYPSLAVESGRRMFVYRDRPMLQRVVEPLLEGRREASVHDMDVHDPELRHSLVPVMIDCLGKSLHPFATIYRTIASDTKDSVIEQTVGEEHVRPLIGFVEEADQSMITGRGRGCGFVSFYRLLEDGPRRCPGNLFWAKNPNERRLVPVKLSSCK